MSDNDKKQQGKDVIYIDVDDEITAIIDKIRGSDQRIVALVLPKRASALQSIVNMKLLKRTADAAKKHIVLITSEVGLLPLAGSVGLHVAKSLQSKPEVPDAPDKPDEQTETVSDEEMPLDKNKSVGELSGAEEETIELDDIDEENPAEASGLRSKFKGKNKKLRIPNFNKFRVLIFAGAGALILLIVGSVMAFSVLPKAEIVVKTDSEALDISQDVSLKTGSNVALDVEKSIIPAQKEEISKEISEEVATTGQQNNGEKAAGSVSMTAKNCSSLGTPKDVPAGTGITANGKTYITQKKANFTGSGTFDGSCLNFEDEDITIVAQSGGAAFNVDSGTFAVVGRSDVSAAGSAAGGTDNITKVVAQSDIDSAKQKIGTQDTEAVKSELATALKNKGLRPIEATFATATPETRQSANAGDAADKVTVTQKVTYSMLGVRDEDVEKIIANSVVDKIDAENQGIIDYGLDDATFTFLATQPDGFSVGLQTTAIAGPDLDANEIKKKILGKKANDAKELIGEYPGVTDVRVTYSPFWVSSIPGKSNKVTLIIEEPQVSDNQDADTSSE